MRTFIRWLAGLAGAAGVVGLLRRRRALPARETAVAPEEPDPAAELRRRLEEARAQPAVTTSPTQPQSSESLPGSEPAAAPEAVPLEERRARLHAKAQEAIESMRTDG